MAKTARLEVRALDREKERVEAAAAVSGQSTSYFILQAALREADSVLGSAEVITVPNVEFDALTDWLDEPATPIPALERAFSRPPQFRRA